MIQRETSDIEMKTDEELKEFQPLKGQIEDEDLQIQYNYPDSDTNYNLVSTLKQRRWGGALTFNSKGTLMAAATKHQIKVWEFINGKLMNPKFIKAYQNCVRLLQFGNKSDFLISNSGDEKFSIWEKNAQDEWKCVQELNEHKDKIHCILINQNDDQIVTCSKDFTIKIWEKDNHSQLWHCTQTLSNIGEIFYSLTLSQSQDVLASSSLNKFIIIWSLDKDKKWRKRQTLKVPEFCSKLCFIGDDQIASQPTNSGIITILQLNRNNSLFEVQQHIQLQQTQYDFCQSAMIFCYKNELLITRHKYFIYIIRRTKENKFNIQQMIGFNTNWNFETITSDGEYLVTWDMKSQEFQVRKKL